MSEALSEQTRDQRVTFSPQAPRALPAWLAITAIILVAIALRPGIVSIGPVLGSIQNEFGLSYAEASLLTAIPDLLMGLLALPTPWLSRRFGRDGVILFALVLLCMSMAVRAFAPTPSFLLLATAGVGAGIAITGSLVAGFIKANFPTRAALLMGIYATSLSLGSTVSAASTDPLANIAPGGWRVATGIWSLLGIIALAAWTTVTISERKLTTAAMSRPSKALLPLRNKTAWMIAIFFAVNNFLFYAMVAWTARMYSETGGSDTIAGFLLASFTASFMLGNPIFGALSKNHDRRGWLAFCCGLALVGLIGMAFSLRSLPFLWVPLTAFGLGGGFTLGMTLPLDNTRDVEEANVWTAFTLTVGYLVAAGGPILVGSMRDATGSFAVPIWLLVLLAGGMLSITALLHPHKRVDTLSATSPVRTG